MSLLRNYIHASTVRRDSAALVLGALLVLVFSPFAYAWLAPVILAAFLMLLEGLDSRQAARTGFIFGFGQFAAGIWWLYISLNIVGGLWPPVAVLMVVCMVTALAAFIALASGLIAWLTPAGNAVRWLLVGPAIWTLAEWLRGWVFTGFPWLSVGYSQTDTSFGLLAPVAGVYGITWATLLAGGVLVSLLVGNLRQRLAGAVCALGLGALLLGLPEYNWTQSTGRELHIRLVQGGISQDIKWELEQLQPTLELYRDLSLSDAADDPDLIVWPEAAIPALPFEVADYLVELNAAAVSRGIQMFIGILTYDMERSGYQNTVWAIGEEEGMYHKRHLVAFGEYFPLPDFARRWLRIMNLPSENILSGNEDQPLLLAQGIPVAVTICYEMAFGAEQLDFFPTAELMVNVSNDAWFGELLAPFQHLQMGRMRAMETGRYLLRATNTGITAVIDPRGQVQERLPQLDAGVIDAIVWPYTGATPYVRMGNWLVVSAMCLLIGIGAWRVRYKPAKASENS